MSDFLYIFRAIAPQLSNLLVARAFSSEVSGSGQVIPQRPHLEEEYGESLVDLDEERQLMLLDGSRFLSWASKFRCQEGEFLPVFEEAPKFELLETLFWRSDEDIQAGRWPQEMRSLIYMWDDIYWEYFSTRRADVETLIATHYGDDRLSLHISDISVDYPEPRNLELSRATPNASLDTSAEAPSFRNQSLEFTDSFSDTRDWIGLCSGDIYFGERPFGTYLAWFKPNSNEPAFIALTLLNEGLEEISTIGLEAAQYSESAPVPVSEDRLPWGSGHFLNYVDPDDVYEYQRPRRAVALVDDIVSNDLALAKHLLDPTITVRPD